MNISPMQKIYYSKHENIPKYNNDENIPPFITRDISNVQDYLKSIELLLNNHYMINYGEDLDNTHHKNIFSIANSIGYPEIIADGIFFRGESRSHDFIQPGIYRNAELFINENKIIEEIEANSPEKFQSFNSEFENLSLLQHYGAPTRLLDITENALVALYFAVSGDTKHDGYIYVISGHRLGDSKNIKIFPPSSKEAILRSSISKLNILQKLFFIDFKRNNRTEPVVKIENDPTGAIRSLISLCEKNITDIESVNVNDLFGSILVRPNRFDSRIARQSGSFILSGLQEVNIQKSIKSDNFFREIVSQDYIELEEYNNLLNILSENSGIFHEDFVKNYLFRYSPESYIGEQSSTLDSAIRISSKYKSQIAQQLRMLGIHAGTVYPDFSHTIQGITEMYRNQDKIRKKQLLSDFPTQNSNTIQHI